MNKPPTLPEFQRYQFAFAAHIRDPEAHPRPAGVDARRMKIYTELLYNNVEGFLLACFPVLRKVLGTRILQHASQPHPLLPTDSRRVCAVSATRMDAARRLPAVSIGAGALRMDRAGVVGVESQRELPRRCGRRFAQWRAGAESGAGQSAYDWPVQRIAPRRKVQPAETWLLVFRDAGDRVEFTEINAFTARLLSLLESGTLGGRAALKQAQSKAATPTPR